MINGIELFSQDNNSENKVSEVARAEQYTRMYKWMAEDFSSTNDTLVLSKNILAWAKSVEKRLTKLGHLVANHTHMIPPHSHIGAGPQVGGFKTFIPVSAAQLTWEGIKEPFKNIENTTGAKSNIQGNKIVTNRIPVIGDREYGSIGRELKIPILVNSEYNKAIIK